MVPPGPVGPGGVFSAYFWPISGHFRQIFFPLFPPLGPYFWAPLLALSGLLCCGKSKGLYLRRSFGLLVKFGRHALIYEVELLQVGFDESARAAQR